MIKYQLSSELYRQQKIYQKKLKKMLSFIIKFDIVIMQEEKVRMIFEN